MLCLGSLKLYIPLCFYYIWICMGSSSDTDIFTFHYASTISERLRSVPFRITAFTFHYASTISGSGTPSPIRYGLYIPLCFYYIKTSDLQCTLVVHFTFHYASTISDVWCDCQNALQPLHSTMLLLYLPWLFLCVFPSTLYIPLCFYYIEHQKEAELISLYPLHSTMLLLYPVTVFPLLFSSIQVHFLSTSFPH